MHADFKKEYFRAGQQYVAAEICDRVGAAMVTSSDEASAVGGKIVPVLCEVDRVKAELRTGQGDPGIDSLHTGDAYLRFDAERTWYRDGFWALGALIFDETRLRVLEVRNALELCGASDFSFHQCYAVFFRESSSVQENMRLRFHQLFSGNEPPPGTLKFEPALKIPLCGRGGECSKASRSSYRWMRFLRQRGKFLAR